MEIFFILVTTHLVADFFLQGNEIALNKRLFNWQMLAHAFVATLAFAIPVYLFKLDNLWLGSGVVFVTHTFIDALRVEIMKKYKINPSKYSFWALLGADQILHISVLYFVLTFAF